MTQQLRAAGALSAAIATVMVLGLPLMILLMLDPSSQAACGGLPTGPGPASVPGIPTNLLPVFEGAWQQYGLGTTAGRTWRRSINYAESTFGTNNAQGPACCRAATRPGRPARCRSGSAAPPRTTGTRSSGRSRPACPAARSHLASTTKPTPSTPAPRC